MLNHSRTSLRKIGVNQKILKSTMKNTLSPVSSYTDHKSFSQLPKGFDHLLSSHLFHSVVLPPPSKDIFLIRLPHIYKKITFNTYIYHLKEIIKSFIQFSLL